MLLAARTLRIPRVLTEADAHLGVANRLAAPIADKVFLAYPLPGRDPPHYEVSGGRSHASTSRRPRPRRGPNSGCRGRLRAGRLRRARRSPQINEACVGAYGASGLEDGIVVHVTGVAITTG